MADPSGHIGWRAGRVAQYTGVDDEPGEAAASATEDDALVSRLVYLVVLLYATTFALLSALQHLSYQTNAFDLGNMDQAVWNTVQGRPLEFTNWPGGTNRLAAHVEPILFLVAQFYRIHSSPLTLLVLQSAVISLGALPAYWLGRVALRSSLAAAVFAFSYLLSPALEIANLSDFHAVALSSAFLLFAFYFAYRQQYVGFFLFAVLAMATKEQVPLSVLVLSGYIALIQRRMWVGAAGILLAAAWLVVAFGIVIPHFNPQGVSPYLSRYDQLGRSPSEIVLALLRDPAGAVQLLSEPAKVDYALNILSPTLYLSLLSPLTLAMAMPDLGINLLSNFTEMYAGRAHYGAVIVPFVTVSAILGAGLLRKGLDRVNLRVGEIGVGLIAVAVLANVLVNFRQQVFLPLADHLPEVSEHTKRGLAIMSLIPAGAAVATSSNLNPQVSQRRQISLFPEIEKADYILLDVSASPYPIDAASMWYRVQQLISDGGWGVEAADDGVLLLKRGGAGRELAAGFTDFARAGSARGRTHVGVQFGEGLRLVGFDLAPEGGLHGADPYATMTLYWTLDRPMTQDFITELSVVTPAGTVLSKDTFQAALLWYPPSRWQPGEVIKGRSLWLPLGAEKTAEVRVRILSREEPHELVTALLPRPESLPSGYRLADGGQSLNLTVLRRN